MAIHQSVLDVFKQQEDLVMALDNPEITEVAKRLAFYDAMIDAAEHDPLDDPEDHNEILQLMKTTRQELVETYQQLVNDAM